MVDSELDRDNVHGWLVGLEQGLPLDGQWELHNPGDPVKELYQSVEVSNSADLPTWIGGAMILTMVCVVFVVLAALGKFWKWRPGHGYDFDLWYLARSAFLQVQQRICDGKSSKKAADVSDYEEAVDRFGVVRIYEGGKRIEERPSPHHNNTNAAAAVPKDMQSTCSSSSITCDTEDHHRDLTEPAAREHYVELPFSNNEKIEKPSILQTIISKLGFNVDKKKCQNEHESDRVQNMRTFQNRPLPTVTDQLSPLMMNKEKLRNTQDEYTSPFLKTNIFTPEKDLPPNKRSWIQKISRTRQGDDFKRVEQILLRDSFDNINTVNNSALLPDSVKNKTMPMKRNVCVPLDETEVRNLRSKSLDDAYDISKRRKNILNYDQDTGHVTINEIYAALSEAQSEAPLGTYGTWEKDGYLQLPYSRHSRPISTAEMKGITLNEEDIKRICSITDDTNPYFSIKSRLSEANIYASIKGQGFVLNIPPESNLYDSIKAVALPIQTDSKNSTHQYAEVNETIRDELKVDVRNRPIPKPAEMITNDMVINVDGGNSIHKYEKIDNIATGNQDKPVAESNQSNHSNMAQAQNNKFTGVYMKFGDVVFWK